METTHTKPIRSKYWWVTLLVGILAVVCGLWVFTHPIASYLTLAVYFAVMLFVLGISEIINSIDHKKTRNWGWGLAMGILDVVIGFILILHIDLSATMLPYVLGFILMYWGIGFIMWAIDLQTLKVKNWGWVLVGGILTMLFAFMIIFHPVLGVWNIVLWTGLALLFGGISAIVLSFSQRRY
ncbi:MAG: HdeD family acid-resistance protein [Culturomica sp.]|jgi:uncharacterized membrane protein HdeD (DUF308 family)|nr:HdeD family acid-resistance protein [Culturomica sp.]